MNRFEWVSYKQFYKDITKTIPDIESFSEEDKSDLSLMVMNIYGTIPKPHRKTKKSSGYDFISPISFDLEPKGIIKVPTGIKCQLDENKFLMIIIRSSMGFTYRIRLINQVGDIDSDYYNNPSNEGHIWIGLENIGDETWHVEHGDAIAQGVILSYYTTVDDDAEEEREGGFGSTNKK